MDEIIDIMLDTNEGRLALLHDKFYLAAPNFSNKTMDKYINTNVGLILMDDEYALVGSPKTNKVFSSAHAPSTRLFRAERAGKVG